MNVNTSKDAASTRGSDGARRDTGNGSGGSAAGKAGHAVAETAKNSAKDIKTTVAETTREVGNEVRRATSRLGERACEHAELQKEQLATVAGDFAAAVERAANELQERGETRTSDLAQTLAEQLHGAASYLSETGIRGVWSDLQQFARRRPGLVVAGMFAAGIAMSRFLKASEAHDGTHGRGDLDGELGGSNGSRYGQHGQYGEYGAHAGTSTGTSKSTAPYTSTGGSTSTGASTSTGGASMGGGAGSTCPTGVSP